MSLDVIYCSLLQGIDYGYAYNKVKTLEYLILASRLCKNAKQWRIEILHHLTPFNHHPYGLNFGKVTSFLNWLTLHQYGEKRATRVRVAAWHPRCGGFLAYLPTGVSRRYAIDPVVSS
jgi:hypothetical protein